MKTIVMVGGGSGGHITPILAVAEAVKNQAPDSRIIYIGQKGDKLADVPKGHAAIDASFGVTAGKFRRYHGAGIKQVFDIGTTCRNLADVFKIVAGIWQSYFLLKSQRPNVIFTPGGFVGVPVGIAARLLRIPFITLDLDAVPGLANRINARHAIAHAVGMPKELYSYPPEKTYYVGVPVSDKFHFVTAKDQEVYEQQLGLPNGGQYLFVTGGGLGAQRINMAMLDIVPRLLYELPQLHIGIAAGRGNDEALRESLGRVIQHDDHQRVKVYDFLANLEVHTGAATLVITRAGANVLAELATQGKAAVVVPHPQLSGGHQLKNAGYLAKRHAVILVTEEDLRQGRATQLLVELLSNNQHRKSLAETLHTFGGRDAAKELANLLLAVQ